MKYIVLLTIDRHPPGTDVTDLYTADQLEELARFGYLEKVTNREAKKAARAAAEDGEEQTEVLEELPPPVAQGRRGGD